MIHRHFGSTCTLLLFSIVLFLTSNPFAFAESPSEARSKLFAMVKGDIMRSLAVESGDLRGVAGRISRGRPG